MEDYKKPIIIGASLAAAGIIFFYSVFLGLFIKNYVEEKLFKPLSRDEFVQIYRRLRKENYLVLKQITLVASQIAAQFKQITPDSIKGYLEGPESPIKIDEMLEKNIEKVCEIHQITKEEFQHNLNHYKDDPELKQLVEFSEKEFETSLTGKLPNFPVKIPEYLNKERILEIQAKIVKQKYLFQIGIFKKLRKYTKQQLAENPELMQGLPNPESEEQMLEEEGLGENDQPASAVLHAAIMKYRLDEGFRQALQSIENSFKNIYSRYEAKINNNKITEAELTELEDEIIYFQYI